MGDSKNLQNIESNIRETFSLSKEFSGRQEDAALRQQAEVFVLSLLQQEASTNEKQEAIFSLASAEQQKLIELGKGFNIRLKDLKKGEEGTEVAALIDKLSQDFDKINPGTIDWSSAPRKGVGKLLEKLPFVGNAVSQYWQKYQDVMAMINENIATLNSLLDKKEKDILLINEKKDAFLKMMDEFHGTIVTGVYIKEALEAKVSDETDEAKKRFIQEHWLYPLHKRILSLQELYLSSYDAAISAELVSRGHRELIMDLREKNKIATMRLQTGVWLAAELYDQKRLLESSKALKETNKKLADAVHNMLGNYQRPIQAEATDSFQSFDQWQQHMQQTSKLYHDAKEFRVNALPLLGKKIAEFGELMTTAGQTADDIKKASETQMPFGG